MFSFCFCFQIEHIIQTFLRIFHCLSLLSFSKTKCVSDTTLSNALLVSTYSYMGKNVFSTKNMSDTNQIRSSNLSIILVSTLPLGHWGLCNSGGRKHYWPRHLPHTVEMQWEASPYVVILVLNKIQTNLSGGFVVQ